MKTHSLDEKFKCDLCAKTFHMKWRLVKHRSQHDLTSVRFCHYFNNNKFCHFYELGCMFKHEHAPICKNGLSCRTKLCQFTHQVFMGLDACSSMSMHQIAKMVCPVEQNCVSSRIKLLWRHIERIK